MTTGVTVDFNANLARFTTSVEKATADLGKFQSKAESVSAKIGSTFQGLAAGLSVGAFTAWIKGSIDAADQMNDLSQRVGIGIKDLAAFELASKQSGTSLESVARGVKGLSGFMIENSAELKKAGITATEANGAIIQLADLFTAMPDGVEKTALAVKLFGKAGMEMIPLLNQGSAGLAEAAEKSKAYGEKLAAMAPNADKFNDQLAELALNSKITGMNIADYLLPGLIGMSQWLNDLKSGGDRASTALEFLSEKSPLFSGLVKLHELLKGGEARSKGYTGEKNALGLPISEAEKAAKDLAAFDAATDAYMKQREAKQRALGLLGKTATEPAGTRDADLERMLKLGQKNLFHSLDSEEEQRVLATKRDMKDIADEYERLQRMLKVGEDNQLALYYETAGEEVMRLVGEQRALKPALDENAKFARDMGLSFASAFEDAVIGGGKLSDVLRGLGKDIARIVLRKTVTEPLGNGITDLIKGSSLGSSLGGSGGLFGGIKSLFGFASGGAFTVGGAGGTDSQLVAFKATPGEEVSVRTPGQQGGGGITIQQHIYPSPGVSSGDLMQAMVAAKNAAVAEIHNSMRRGGAFA